MNRWPDKCPNCKKDMEIHGLARTYPPRELAPGTWECPHCKSRVGNSAVRFCNHADISCRCARLLQRRRNPYAPCTCDGPGPFAQCVTHQYAGSPLSPRDARGLLIDIDADKRWQMAAARMFLETNPGMLVMNVKRDHRSSYTHVFIGAGYWVSISDQDIAEWIEAGLVRAAAHETGHEDPGGPS